MQWSQVKAVVTGGASGLGLAVAMRIVKSGGQVAILDKDEALARQQLSSLSENAIAVGMDVRHDNSVDNAIQLVNEDFGYINLAVNCAGILLSKKMISSEGVMPSNDFDRLMSVNVIGTFRVCRAVADVMSRNVAGVDEERGVIINTASIAAFEGQIGQLAYSASKGAIVSMTLPMARELARHNIRVCAIAPGVFETAMMAELPEQVKNQLSEQMLFPHRMGEPEEFAQMVQQIVENTMLNACVIRLDGGLRMPAR